MMEAMTVPVMDLAGPRMAVMVVKRRRKAVLSGEKENLDQRIQNWKR